MTKSIKNMSIGEKGIIESLEINTKARTRFMDLGIAPLAELKLIKKINLNNLFIIEVDDVEICIRKADAENIYVKLY